MHHPLVGPKSVLPIRTGSSGQGLFVWVILSNVLLEGIPQNFIWLEWDGEELLATSGALKAVAVFGPNQSNCSFHINGKGNEKSKCFFQALSILIICAAISAVSVGEVPKNM